MPISYLGDEPGVGPKVPGSRCDLCRWLRAEMGRRRWGWRGGRRGAGVAEGPAVAVRLVGVRGQLGRRRAHRRSAASRRRGELGKVCAAGLRRRLGLAPAAVHADAAELGGAGVAVGVQRPGGSLGGSWRGSAAAWRAWARHSRHSLAGRSSPDASAAPVRDCRGDARKASWSGQTTFAARLGVVALACSGSAAGARSWRSGP